MKRLLSFVLLFLPSLMHAMPVDSVLPGSFKTKFQFTVTATGVFYTESIELGNDTGIRSIGATFLIDPSDSNRNKLHGDVMPLISTDGFITASLVFDTVANRIKHLGISYSVGQDIAAKEESYTRWNISLSNLEYNDSSIFTRDFSLRGHEASVSYFDHYQYHPFPPRDTYLDSLISISITGVEPASHLTNIPSSGVRPQFGVPQLMSYPTGNGFALSFEPSDAACTVVVYSALGQQIALQSIAPGQRSTTFSGLATGIYFVRFGSEVLKIYISE